MLSLLTPAKVNLTLEVLGERADGYHEVRTIMQAVGLCDQLSFTPGTGFDYSCDDPSWQSGSSLVSRAAELMKRETGYGGGAGIDIQKRIPLTAGLGGDASDAAAVLRGLDGLWGLSLDLEKLEVLAARLGSDVPFFLRGGTVLAEGRGEILRRLPALPPRWVVIVMPGVPVPANKTKELYTQLNHSHFTDGKRTDEVIALLTRGQPVEDHLYNAFDQVADAVFVGLEGYRAAFLDAGASAVHMAGAGPVLFSLHRRQAEAERVARTLGARGLEAWLAPTLEAPGACPC